MLRDSHPHNPHREAAELSAHHATTERDKPDLKTKIDLSREALGRSAQTAIPLQATRDASLDLVVSTHIAESEKDLDEILHHVENNSSILLFDEADALVSKRTDVEDAHGKYSSKHNKT